MADILFYWLPLVLVSIVAASFHVGFKYVLEPEEGNLRQEVFTKTESYSYLIFIIVASIIPLVNIVFLILGLLQILVHNDTLNRTISKGD